MLKSSLLKLSVLSLFVAPCLSAAPLQIVSGAATFLAKGKPGFLTINGTGADITGALDKDAKGITGVLKVPVGKFVTGIDLRDEHMKEKYLKVKEHPEAVLTIKEFALDGKGQASGQTFKGTLKLVNEERPVEGKADFTADGKVSAKFEINLKEFKIEIPKYAGVTVAETVEVEAKLATKEGTPAAKEAVSAAKPAAPAAKEAKPAAKAGK